MDPRSSLISRERSLYTAFSDRALEARQRELARLQEQISTGRRINRASDAPSDFARARQMEVLENRFAQYQRSVQAARTWVDHTQAALDDLSELFMQAYERGIRIANGTFSGTDREAEAKQLESLMQSIVDRLNARSGSEYLFAGSRTTVRPFEPTGATVTYAGNDGDRRRHIGPDQSLKINISGERLRDTGSGFTITESLQNLIDAVRTGDADALSTALEQVTRSRDHVIDLGAEAGAAGHRLTLAAYQLEDATLLAQGRRSELEDADLAETLLHLQREQTGLQAAMKVAASILQTSLLNFFR